MRTPPPPEVRATIAQLAAAERWMGTTAAERKEAIKPALQAYAERWERLARERWPHLDGDDLARAADHLKRAHYRRMTLASVRSRHARKNGGSRND